MTKQFFCVMFLIWGLSGCALLEQFSAPEEPVENVTKEITKQEAKYCLVSDESELVDHNCDIAYWLTFWLDADGIAWPERREKIEQLGEGVFETLQKVLLSQSRGTPYQARLRAQSWANELMPKLTNNMQNLLKVLVYKPSQEMLEFESALTILTRINTNQSKELERQTEQLAEQQQQIEQLLKIEASMMQKKEGISL